MTTKRPLPILYSFRRCPYAIRARLALYYCGINVELREVVLKDKPKSMLEYSPKGTVPVLVLPDNRVIDESIDIVGWALTVDDKSELLVLLSEKEAAQARSLIEENYFEFKPMMDRYKYADRHPEKTQREYRTEAEYFLKKLELRLSEGKYLIGNKISIADIAIFSFIRQFAFVDKTWFDRSIYTELQRWLEQGLQSEAFIYAMEKIPRWLPGQPIVIFPK